MKLYDSRRSQGLITLRRVLANYGPRDAMEALFKLLKRFPTNDEFLESMSAQS